MKWYLKLYKVKADTYIPTYPNKLIYKVLYYLYIGINNMIYKNSYQNYGSVANNYEFVVVQIRLFHLSELSYFRMFELDYRKSGIYTIVYFSLLYCNVLQRETF